MPGAGGKQDPRHSRERDDFAGDPVLDVLMAFALVGFGFVLTLALFVIGKMVRPILHLVEGLL